MYVLTLMKILTNPHSQKEPRLVLTRVIQLMRVERNYVPDTEFY